MIERPKDPNGIFQLDESVEVVRKGLTPMQRQRQADGSPHTRHGHSKLRPEGPRLHLGSDKISKSKDASLNERKESDPAPDPDAVVKAYLNFNA